MPYLFIANIKKLKNDKEKQIYFQKISVTVINVNLSHVLVVVSRCVKPSVKKMRYLLKSVPPGIGLYSQIE